MLKPYYISTDNGETYTLQYLTFEESEEQLKCGYTVLEPITKQEAAAYYKTEIYKKLRYCQKNGTPLNAAPFPIPHNSFYVFEKYVSLMELDQRNKPLSFYIKR